MQKRSFSEIDEQGPPRPRRSLSQNFLVDQNIAKKIVKAVCIKDGDLVIEIGAGTGALTRHLASGPGAILAVEKDRRLWKSLEDEFRDVRIFGADFLKFDLGATLGLCPATDGKARKAVSGTVASEDSGKFKVVGNVPYNLTTKILLHLIKYRQYVSMAILMVQKEFAERMVAPPGGKSYGSLTVLLAYHGKVEKLFGVSRNCFKPKPGVDSSVVRIEFCGSPRLSGSDEDFFFRVVRGSFGKRRKMLVNALSSSLDVGKSTIEAGMTKAGIDPGRRAESLTLEEFLVLSNSLKDYMS